MRRSVTLVLAVFMLLSMIAGCKTRTDGAGVNFPPAAADTTSDPVIAAAGDIACDPASSYFSGSNSKYCQDEKTADVARNINPDMVIPLGDLQYTNGTLGQFQNSYSRSWGKDDIKSKTFPVVGNHEYLTPNAQGYRDYFGLSDSDLTTSKVVGSWRIFNINSNCTKVNCSGLASWMKKKMAESPTKCTLAAWHHPYRTDVAKHYPGASASKVFEQAFYDARGEVVLNGHAHSIEVSNKITPGGSNSSRGTKHFTIGSGGKESYLPWQHSTKPSWTHYRAKTKHAVLKMTLHPTSYDYKIVATDGSTLLEGTRSCF